MNDKLNQLIDDIATETGSCQDDLVNAINQEKLDAAKWGAEQAASLGMFGNKNVRDGNRDNILAFANNLTIDQLPF